jgi:hypothetical protein
MILLGLGLLGLHVGICAIGEGGADKDDGVHADAC